MPSNRPIVEAGRMYDPRQPAVSIRLDTPAWLAWLEADTTTRFTYALFDPRRGYNAGWMTVRTERRQRGGSYWAAFRRQDGVVRKVYLGRSTAVTAARLAELAQAFTSARSRPESNT